MKKISFIAIGIAFLMACGSATQEPSVKEEPAKKSTKNVAKVREISELAGIMLTMHDQFKEIRGYVERGEAIPDSLQWSFEAMKTAQPTKDMSLDAGFEGMATAFLVQLDTTVANPSIATYNDALNSCISCHQNYCPGPIARIKKLKLKEGK